VTVLITQSGGGWASKAAGTVGRGKECFEYFLDDLNDDSSNDVLNGSEHTYHESSTNL
jgi:hypothetical protein